MMVYAPHDATHARKASEGRNSKRYLIYRFNQLKKMKEEDLRKLVREEPYMVYHERHLNKDELIVEMIRNFNEIEWHFSKNAKN